MAGTLTGTDRFWVPASLAFSCLANDGEEWFTMASTAEQTWTRLPRWAPRPAFLATLDAPRARTAITVMGVLYAAAVIDGWRTGGRGRLYQDIQLVFGLHGFGHLAASAASRGYASGVVTSPTVVIPQWLYARSRLRQAGVPTTAHPVRAALRVGGWLLAAHAIGHTRSGRPSPRRSGSC